MLIIILVHVACNPSVAASLSRASLQLPESRFPMTHLLMAWKWKPQSQVESFCDLISLRLPYSRVFHILTFAKLFLVWNYDALWGANFQHNVSGSMKSCRKCWSSEKAEVFFNALSRAESSSTFKQSRLHKKSEHQRPWRRAKEYYHTPNMLAS